MRILILILVAIQTGCNLHSAKEFIAVGDPVVALTHVRVIDGTGGRALEDQTIVIESGRIRAIAPTGIVIPPNAKVLDLNGHTVFPGLVGMHEHLFYSTDAGDRDVPANVSFPRLYLASGVTTIRTAGTLSLETDLQTKQAIDRGEAPGPKIHLTSPYINRPAGEPLTAERIDNAVTAWAEQGVTSLKVYTNIGRTELDVIIASARKHGLKVTGHLCAVGFREAAASGIDNLEHGLTVDTEFYSRKSPDQCPDRSYWLPELSRIDVRSPAVQQTIRDLVSHHVAITSTLPVFETFIGEKFKLDPRMQSVLTESAYESCQSQIARDRADPRWSRIWQVVLRQEMEFEREFVKAGGLLLAGVDPTGWGGAIAGYGDQRGLELLVEAGFTPEEAFRIASANGAMFLGESERIGTLAVGKQADIVVVRGNPSVNIKDVRNVTLVFKDGVGYDPAKLVESIRGQVGQQ